MLGVSSCPEYGFAGIRNDAIDGGEESAHEREENMKISKVMLIWLLRVMCLVAMLQIPNMQAHAGSGLIIDDVKFEFWDADGKNKIEDKSDDPIKVEPGETLTVKLKIKDRDGAAEKTINKVEYGNITNYSRIIEQNNTFVCETINWPDPQTLFGNSTNKINEIPITIRIKKDAKVNTKAQIAVKEKGESATGKSGNLHIKVIESSKDPISTTNEASHSHDMEWETIREATMEKDGIESYRCKTCGYTEETLMISAATIYVKDLYTAVDKAANTEITFDAKFYHTISDPMLEKLAKKNDLTVHLNFRYKNSNYQITFPAGCDYTELLKDNVKYYGFLGLNGYHGISVERQ